MQKSALYIVTALFIATLGALAFLLSFNPSDSVKGDIKSFMLSSPPADLVISDDDIVAECLNRKSRYTCEASTTIYLNEQESSEAELNLFVAKLDSWLEINEYSINSAQVGPETIYRDAVSDQCDLILNNSNSGYFIRYTCDVQGWLFAPKALISLKSIGSI